MSKKLPKLSKTLHCRSFFVAGGLKASPIASCAFMTFTHQISCPFIDPV